MTASAICSRIDSASEDVSAISSPPADVALRVEVADVATLRPDVRIDRAIDQGRLPRSQGRGEGLREPGRIDGVITDTAKGLDHLVVTGFLHQGGRRRVGPAAEVNAIAAVDAAVVEDDSDDRQLVTADGF